MALICCCGNCIQLCIQRACLPGLYDLTNDRKRTGFGHQILDVHSGLAYLVQRSIVTPWAAGQIHCFNLTANLCFRIKFRGIGSATRSSCRILLEPLLPLSHRPARRYAAFFDSIEQDRRSDMDTCESVGLDHQLDVVGNLVSDVQTTVVVRLVRNQQQVQNGFLVHPVHRARQLGQSPVGVVAYLVDDVDVKVVGLLLEELLRERPERFGSRLQYGGAGFVHERRRWVPRLDLLSEYDPNSWVCILGSNDGDDLVVERLEDLCGERADVVQVDLDCVFGFNTVRSGRGEQLPGELGW